MELVNIDTSRVILLTEIHRPNNASYLPEVIAKLVQRYGFAQYPTAEQLLKNELTFGMGKFGDSGILELRVYTDGVIVTSRATTDILEAFIIDAMEWLRDEFQIVPTSIARPEWHFESVVVVRADADLLSLMRPQKAAVSAINNSWEAPGYHPGHMQSTGVTFTIDQPEIKSRRKPFAFTLERRTGYPFEENIFFSGAPFRTKDHLAVLGRLEELARG
jgi:hypothetical protein